jgi:hypothetical protein
MPFQVFDERRVQNFPYCVLNLGTHQKLQAQIVMCQLTGASLTRRSDSEYLSDGQRTEIIRRRDQSLNESFALQLMVDLLERREREGMWRTI